MCGEVCDALLAMDPEAEVKVYHVFTKEEMKLVVQRVNNTAVTFDAVQDLCEAAVAAVAGSKVQKCGLNVTPRNHGKSSHLRVTSVFNTFRPIQNTNPHKRETIRFGQGSSR